MDILYKKCGLVQRRKLQTNVVKKEVLFAMTYALHVLSLAFPSVGVVCVQGGRLGVAGLYFYHERLCTCGMAGGLDAYPSNMYILYQIIVSSDINHVC